jgi:hypothetical protein
MCLRSGSIRRGAFGDTPIECPRGSSENPRIALIVFEIGEHSQTVQMTEKDAINYLLTSMRGGPDKDLRRAFEAMRSVKSYRRLIRHAAKSRDTSREFRERFHTAWTTRGFRWRDAIDDDAFLSRALRSILHGYEGEALRLFRGEQSARYDAGRLGFNWTPKRGVAEMFASGLCTLYEGGGVLLKAHVPSTAIIASPGIHSTYLSEDEFVVEPGLLTNVIELVRHPTK